MNLRGVISCCERLGTSWSSQEKANTTFATLVHRLPAYSRKIDLSRLQPFLFYVFFEEAIQDIGNHLFETWMSKRGLQARQLNRRGLTQQLGETFIRCSAKRPLVVALWSFVVP